MDGLSTVTTPRAQAVLDALARETSSLYAVLDTARDDDVLPWVRAVGEPVVCLYDGWQAEELSDVAPYLVALPSHGPARGDLVRRAWGAAWGVYLASDLDMRELRRHLRRFLRVTVEGRGRMLFRYYDPRVLRAFLPTCSLEEANTFFGPIDCFISEGHTGESLTRFTVTPEGVAAEALALPEATEFDPPRLVD